MASRFLKFVGPMRTLSQRGTKFEKGKIYRVDDEDRALDMIESGRFQEVRDPTKKKAETEAPRRRGGVQIRRGRERVEDSEVNSERGDLGRDDLLNLSDPADDNDGDEDEQEPRQPDRRLTPVGEEGQDDPNRPKLPAQQFTSKNGAVKWAKDNLDVDLDKSRSLSELNRVIVTEYGKKYAAPKTEAEDDDDTRDENTAVDPIVVA